MIKRDFTGCFSCFLNIALQNILRPAVMKNNIEIDLIDNKMKVFQSCSICGVMAFLLIIKSYIRSRSIKNSYILKTEVYILSVFMYCFIICSHSPSFLDTWRIYLSLSFLFMSLFSNVQFTLTRFYVQHSMEVIHISLWEQWIGKTYSEAIFRASNKEQLRYMWT